MGIYGQTSRHYSLLLHISDLCILPTTFSYVDATVDDEKVTGDNGMFIFIDDTDERTCLQIRIAFLKDKGLADANVIFPEGYIVGLCCVKMNDACLHGGRPH